MRYKKPEIVNIEPAILAVQSMAKISPPTPDSSFQLTVAAYQSDE